MFVLLFVFFIDCFVAKPIQLIDRQNRAIEILYQITGYEGPYKIDCVRFKNKHCIYKVDYAEKSYIIRFNEDDLDAARADEIAFHYYAQEQGFGPKVLYASTDEGIIIMEYLISSVSDHVLLNRKMQIDSLVDCIRKIHASALICRPQDSFISRSLTIFSSYALTNGTNFANLNALRECLVFLENCIDKTVKPVFVHGDLHRFNLFLCGDTYKAIDFERGHYDHPYVDLARTAVFFGFDFHEETYFLEQYWDRPITRYDIYQFTIFKLFNISTLALWMLKTLKDDFIAFQEMFHVKPLKTYLEDPLYSDLTECCKDSNQGWRYRAATAALKEAERLLAFLQNGFSSYNE